MSAAKKKKPAPVLVVGGPGQPAESWVICTFCKEVISTRDIAPVFVKLDDGTTVRGHGCQPCREVVR